MSKNNREKKMNLNNKRTYNEEKRQFSLNQFIAIFPNAINDDLCSAFVNYFNSISEQCLTMSSMQEAGIPESIRKVPCIPNGRSL